MIAAPKVSRLCLSISGNACSRHVVDQRAFTRSALLGAKKKLAVTSPGATTPQATAQTGATKYPHLLTIWDAGNKRNALVGTIRLLPVALFVSTCFTMNAIVASNNLETWHAIPILLTLAAPMPIMSAILSPYVGQVRILVPPQARQTKEALMKWANNVPENTILEFQMQNMMGLKKSGYYEMKQLKPVTTRSWELSNIESIADPLKDTRSAASPWTRLYNWIAEPSRKMYVGGPEGMKKSMVPGVWTEILRQINHKVAR